MKRILKELVAVFMVAAIIISFISQVNVNAKESRVGTLQKGNIILYENKNVGIKYTGNGDDVKIYQIAQKGSNGFTLDSQYKSFFGDMSSVVNDSQNTEQVAYAKYDSNTLVWYKDEPQQYDFKFEWKGVALDKNNLELEFLSMGINTSEERTRLSECLHNYCNSNESLETIKVDYAYTEGVEKNNGYYKYNDLTYGYYLIDINIKTQNNQIIGMPSILVTLDEKTVSQEGTGEALEMNLRVNPKGKLPTINKYIYNKNGLNKNSTSKTGEEIRYMIVYDLPDLRNTTINQSTIYKIYDTMEHQTFKEGSLNLSIRRGIDSIVSGAKDNYYTFDIDDTKKKFSIQLTEVALREIKNNYEKWQDCMIVADYVVTLDENAKFQNKNTTYLEYGGNKTENATSHVYTYKMNIQKLFSDGSNDFKNVEFKLYDEKKEKAYKFKESNITNENSTSSRKYIYSNSELETTDTLKPDSNGDIEIFGLDARTYWLVEKNTKEGFEKKDLKVTINPSFTSGETVPNLNIESDESEYVSIIELEESGSSGIKNQVGVNVKVVNRIKGLLPETGSIGTIIFTLVGFALIALAASMFRKNNKNK